ncbi:MAG: rhodanese-like domain-containing protein [Planctomycetota bacterium]
MNLSYVKPLYFSTLILAVLLEPVIANNTIAVKEQTRKTVNSSAKQCRSSGAYCGIYCLYTVMKLSSMDVKPAELLKPEYIGSPRGSSLAELKKAAEDHGMYAAPVGKLTSRELRKSPYPVILHVKSAADKKQYDHYELFLKTKNGQAKLCDPPQPPRVVPFYQLAPRWDGTGLIVSTDPIDLAIIFAPARKRFAIYAAIAVVVILGLRWGRRRWLTSATMMSRRRLFGLSIAQGTGLAIAALLCGMAYHFVNDEGFLAHANATDSIQQAHLGNFLPKVSEEEVRRLLNSNTIFVDARSNGDFEAGHLEGAINVPVNAGDDERSKAMADIAKDAHILVYCQTSGCWFAEKVAIKLISDGFSNISLFKGDWRKLAAKSNE